MFIKTFNIKELWIDEKRGTIVAGVPVLIIRTDQGIVAFNDHCPHAGALLSEGTLKDNIITCARHEWQFSADTGIGINPIHTQLCQYPVYIDDAEDIWINIRRPMKNKQNYNDVGPVLVACELANKIIASIKKTNMKVKVQNQGSYLRILVPFHCTLSRLAIEEQTGTTFVLPDDLELIMPSFKGIFTVSKDEAQWSFEPIKQDGQP